jgi:hypothetical protein
MATLSECVSSRLAGFTPKVFACARPGARCQRNQPRAAIKTAIRTTPLSPAQFRGEGHHPVSSPTLALATADMLSDFAQCEELFHTVSGTAFADIIIAGHRETWPICSKRFRAFLKRSYYHAAGGAASTAEIRSTLDLLEARAQFDGPQRPVHVRIAEHAGHIYLDLADELWRAVDIGPDGWRAIASPPVRFRRPAGMLPLPVPERGGSIEVLNSFLNLGSPNDFVLIVALAAGGIARRWSVSPPGDIG